ncbi:MAG: translation elongation factor-like protein [Patescibacteria group bacterium]|nr:translation elongation factor-like protein [Patescibacteria group bacterium]
MAEKEIGKVTHYFSEIGVAVFKLNGAISVGNEVKIQGHTTDFTQEITEMQVDHKSVEKAGKGDDVGVKVKDKVREGDTVYLVS